MSGVMETKLIPPELRHKLVDRPRLLRVFSDLRGRKGAFLVAPAGYGKTSLLLQALRAAGIPIVWYRLDAHDNDLCVFVRHLEAGLKKRLGSSDHEMPGLRKAKSVADSSVVEQSVVKQSAEGQSVEGRSVVQNTGADRSAAQQSAIHGSVAHRSAADQSDAQQSPTQGSVAHQSAADRSAADQSAADQSAERQSAIQRSVADQSAVDRSLERSLVSSFTNYLAACAHDGLVIVLDDWHTVRDPGIHSFVKALFLHLPPGIHMAISSRTSLPTSFSPLLIRGQAVVLSAPELSFNVEEIRAFVSQDFKEARHRVPHQAILDFQQLTGGWPAALTLLEDESLHTWIDSNSFSLDAHHLDSRIRQIYEYLETEVLNEQPDDIRRFLLATSVLTSLTPEKCDNLLSITDSARILDYLNLQQLFIVPLEGDKNAYRYHELFRRFLLNRLGPARKSMLIEAGQKARQAGEFEEAAEYFSFAEAEEDTLSVIKELIRQDLHAGRWQAARKRLKRISAVDLASDPWLSLYKAHTEFSRGKLVDAETWVVRANRMFESSGERLGLSEGQVLMAQILRSRGLFHESMESLDQACKHLTEQEIREHSQITLERALNLFMIGEPDQAMTLLINAFRQAQEQNDSLALAYIAETLGNLSYIQGDCQEALRVFELGVEAHPEFRLPGYWLEEGRCWIYLGWGQLDKALRHAKTNLEARKRFDPAGTLPAAYGYVGCVYTELGELKLAEDHYRKALELGEEFSVRAFAKAHRARCLGLQGRWAEALSAAKEVLDEFDNGSILQAICKVIVSTVFIQVGDPLGAKSLLEDAIKFMDRCGMSGQPACNACGLLSGVLFSMEDTSDAEISAARDYARRHITIAARMNYVQNLLMKADDLYDAVLGECLKSGFEVDFCQRLLVQRGVRSLRLLTELAADNDPKVRLRTVVPLADIGGKPATDIVKSLTHDSDPQVRQSAAAAARRFVKVEAGGARSGDEPPLQVLTLGPLRIIVQGKEITALHWRTTKARDLLAYLAHRIEPTSTEQVLDALWPGVETKKALTSFHSTMYRLKQALRHVYPYPGDFVLHSGKRYQLNESLISTDRRRFEKLAAGVLREEVSTETVPYLEEMVSLYRGEYLADLDYVWVIQDREHLQQLYSDVSIKLAQYYFKEGQYSEVIKYLRPLTAANPVSEELCCLLMKAYAGIGDKRAIAKQYRALRTALAEELGLSPSAATRNLYYRLCRN